MKMDDVFQHNRMKAMPKLQADTDTLNSLWTVFQAAANSAASGMTHVQPIRQPGKTETVNLAGLGYVVVMGEPGPMTGVAACTHCLRIGVEALRETADTLEDMIKFIETHGEKIGE